MRSQLLSLALLGLALSTAQAGPDWTHQATMGEDASGGFRYFFEEKNGEVTRLRSVWVGAQADPEVVDYEIEGNGAAIVVRHATARKGRARALLAGKNIKLKEKSEERIVAAGGESLLDPSASLEHLKESARDEVRNLFELLAIERDPT